MAPRKRLRPKGASKKSQAPETTTEQAPEPEEQKPSTEFAEVLAEYRAVEDDLKALEDSIAERKAELTKARDAAKAHLTDIVEAAGVKKMESEYGRVTLVRPTRHEVDETYLRATLPSDTWKAITVTTTSIEQKKLEAAIVDGLISKPIFDRAVKEVPANKGHTKVTLTEPKEQGDDR